MRTEELEEYMLRDPFIRQFYGGVVALDQLPKVIEKPTIYVVNSDPAHLPGRHWLAIFFDRVNEHFDSAGLYPSKSLEVELIAHGPRFRYNDQRVQAFRSDSCGLFCLFYCYFRCRSFSFKEIMSMFSNNLKLNEAIVIYFYENTK